jgi:hypothetical protein
LKIDATVKADSTYTLGKQSTAWALLFLLLIYSVFAQLPGNEMSEISENHPVTVSLWDNPVLTLFCQIPSAKYEFGNHRGVISSFLNFVNSSPNINRQQLSLLQSSAETFFRLTSIPAYLFICILRI